MPIPKKYYEQLQVGRAEEARKAKGDTRRDLIRTALVCWGWCALGGVFVAWAFHTTNEQLGWASLYTGIIISVAGQVHALAGAYRRGEKRGDW